VKFQGTEFYINFDQFEKPDLGNFVEIKTRTWSRSDAKRKAEMASELLAALQLDAAKNITDDYIEIA